MSRMPGAPACKVASPNDLSFRNLSSWAVIATLFIIWTFLVPQSLKAQVDVNHWRGLVVAPEHRCSPYARTDYRYPQSVEPRIVASMGGRIYGPYTGKHYASMSQTDIEHIVAISEAHDSGLCSADLATRRRFAADTLNLTLASPVVNRCGKGGKCANDAAEWQPETNRCWFAGRVVAVRRKYGLTIDGREAVALETVLSGCANLEMIIATPSIDDSSSERPVVPPATGSRDSVDALRLWDENGNGRITCSEATRHGSAPVPRGHPAYRYMYDADGDGVVCE